MQNGGEGLSSIILAGRGILVKMLITLEPHGLVYLIEICVLIHFEIIETQLCKTVIMLCQDLFLFVAKPSHCFAYLCLDNVKMY